MKIQIRYNNGKIVNTEVDNFVDFDSFLSHRVVEKVSFDFLDGARLILRHDGTYQILGGTLNYPRTF